jgi:hypothetical protein
LGNPKLRIVVDRGDIIITQPGTTWVAVYYQPGRQPYLVAKDAPVGPQDFRTRAWQAAVDKARELRWIRPVTDHGTRTATNSNFKNRHIRLIEF